MVQILAKFWWAVSNSSQAPSSMVWTCLNINLKAIWYNLKTISMIPLLIVSWSGWLSEWLLGGEPQRILRQIRRRWDNLMHQVEENPSFQDEGVHSTHPDTPSIGFIYTECVMMCVFHMFAHVCTIADFRMLSLSKCWIPFSFASFFRQFAAAPNISRDMATRKQKIYGVFAPWNFEDIPERKFHLLTIEFQGGFACFCCLFQGWYTQSLLWKNLRCRSA